MSNLQIFSMMISDLFQFLIITVMSVRTSWMIFLIFIVIKGTHMALPMFLISVTSWPFDLLETVCLSLVTVYTVFLGSCSLFPALIPSVFIPSMSFLLLFSIFPFLLFSCLQIKTLHFRASELQLNTDFFVFIFSYSLRTVAFHAHQQMSLSGMMGIWNLHRIQERNRVWQIAPNPKVLTIILT